MARTLSIACARVPGAHQPEWLAAVAQLAKALGTRGQHLWVFQSERDPELWIEFTEGGDRATHRVVGPRPDAELALEARLRQFARYEPDPSALWTEVPLPKES